LAVRKIRREALRFPALRPLAGKGGPTAGRGPALIPDYEGMGASSLRGRVRVTSVPPPGAELTSIFPP
jgi:hypothetical protein